MSGEWEEYADMLIKLCDEMRERLDERDLMCLATMVTLQEVCGDIKGNAENRAPLDPRSKRMIAGRCTLELLGVSDTMIEQMRASLLGQHPRGANVIPTTNRRQ